MTQFLSSLRSNDLGAADRDSSKDVTSVAILFEPSTPFQSISDSDGEIIPQSFLILFAGIIVSFPDHDSNEGQHRQQRTKNEKDFIEILAHPEQPHAPAAKSF